MAGNRQDHGEPEVRPTTAEGTPAAPPEAVLAEAEARHEARDVDAWAVGKFGIGLVLLCIFALAVLVGFFHYLESTVPPPEAVRQTPPQPRLETTPTVDIKAMHDAEDSILTSYGWVDHEKGVVRIPIDVAIDLLAQRGLPSRPQNGVQSASDASVPVESGLGEKMQQVGGPLAGVSKAAPK